MDDGNKRDRDWFIATTLYRSVPCNLVEVNSIDQMFFIFFSFLTERAMTIRARLER